MTKEEWENFLNIQTYAELKSFSERYKNSDLNFEVVQEEIAFLYNLGLFYSEHYDTQNKVDELFRREDEYYLSMFYYLKAIKLYEDNKDSINKDVGFLYGYVRRLYVNIGVELSDQFRTISALSYFRKALEIDESFDMAIGNFAICIEHHNSLLGLADEKFSMVYNLLSDLYDDIIIENLENGQELFINKKRQYSNFELRTIGDEYDDKRIQYIPYDTFTEIEEDNDSYENWCVKNTLYLNCLNDIGRFEEAMFDIDLSTVNEKMQLDEPRLYSLRNLFFQYTLLRRKIFNFRNLDNEEVLFELAQTFQSFYSFFDRIAFFIYKFFKLQGDERGVNINKVWCMKDEDGNCIMEYRNQHLYDIYWLRKEYRENTNKQDDLKINELLSPDAQDYAEIRNMLEHKEYSFIKIEGIPYLEPAVLYNKTVKIAGVVRNIILSLVQLILTEKPLCDPETNKRNLNLIYLSYGGFVG